MTPFAGAGCALISNEWRDIVIRESLEKLLARIRKPRLARPKVKRLAQLALPQRVDLPLRERSHATAALPANISGAHMGTGKL